MELEGFPIALFPCSWSCFRSCWLAKFTERSSSVSRKRRNRNALLSLRRLTILFWAILLPIFLTSCGKKDQDAEKKTVQKSEDFDPYFNLKIVLVEEGGQLKIGYFEFLPPSMMD
jgi:hypothetical protein